MELTGKEPKYRLRSRRAEKDIESNRWRVSEAEEEISIVDELE